VRVLACAAAVFVLLVPSAAATPSGLKLLERSGNTLTLAYLDRATPFEQPLVPTPCVLAFSGDARLISIGGTIVGRTHLPTKTLTWSPVGERAAYTTTQGAVVLWTPGGKRKIEPNGWATRFFGPLALAWSSDGTTLAVSRGSSIWSWRGGVVRELVHSAPPFPGTGGPAIALPVAWVGDRVLWWDWPGSGSVASDGVSLYEGTQKLGTMLMYRDWLAVCGRRVAFSAGRDRESTNNKIVMLDGRDVSRDPKLSWAGVACSGSRLVASASRNLIPRVTYETHRAIWQLLPERKQLTRPPWGWSDEDPRLYADGSLLFVRTRARSHTTGTGTWTDTQRGQVMLLANGRLRRVGTIGFAQPSDVYTYPVQFYGHYDWSQNLAVAP
jgi:hypothetical protein